MITLPTGSVLFKPDEQVPFVLANYVRDQENPRLFRPAFCECRHRCKEVKSLPCGKIIVTWSCNLLQTLVSVPFCNECQVEDKK